MASVASQLIEEVTAHAQSDSLEDARVICADGTYFPNNLHTSVTGHKYLTVGLQLYQYCRCNNSFLSPTPAMTNISKTLYFSREKGNY